MKSQLQTNTAVATNASLTAGILQRKCDCGNHTMSERCDSCKGGSLLQRKCDCGNHASGGECRECHKHRESLQRATRTTDFAGHGDGSAPPIVHEVLNSPGHPLDQSARTHLEPVLGEIFRASPATRVTHFPQRMTISRPNDFHEREADRIAEIATARLETPGVEPPRAASRPTYDLSRVRIHTDIRAAESAAAVNSLAYTVGDHIVFARGSYAPGSRDGLRLLTHELAHTAQQVPVVSRVPAGPCLTACADVKPPSALRTEAGKEAKARREARTKACAKKPADPACRAGGHGDRAVEIEKVLRAYDPSRFAFTKGFFIDLDLETGFKALTQTCSSITPPPFPDGFCITVHKETEDEAKEFNNTSGPKQIGGVTRDEWRAKILEVLVHEAEHTRFKSIQVPRSAANPGGAPTLLGKARLTCSTDTKGQQDIFGSLNELGSMLQEFRMRTEYVRANVALSAAERTQEMEEWRDHRMRGKEQSIPNSIKVVRCLCGCDDANALIRETIKFATSSWTPEEVLALDLEMTHYRYSDLDLNWPMGPASQKAVPDRLLPKGQEMA